MTETRADRRLVSSGSPFERSYGYSRALVRGDEVLIAGTTGYDYARMAMPKDVAEQTRNIYATFAEVMKDAGGELLVAIRRYHQSGGGDALARQGLQQLQAGHVGQAPAAVGAQPALNRGR